jgi:hypothetical protein
LRCRKNPSFPREFRGDAATPDFDGSAYRPSHLTGGIICAPDEANWSLARDALFEPHEATLRMT